jgi:hypothetical protein
MGSLMARGRAENANESGARPPRPPTLLVRMRFNTLEEFHERYEREISLGRLWIKTLRPRKQGSVVSIELEIAPVQQVLSLSGRVANVVFPGEGLERGEEAGMEVRITDLDAAKRQRVTALLSRVSAAAPATTPARPRRGSDLDLLMVSLEAREFLGATRGKDFYQVLGVDRDARTSEIRRAFLDLAQRFFPDRYFRRASPDTSSDLEDVYSAIAEAYETLTRKERRVGYDISIGHLGGNADGISASEMSRRAAQENRRRSSPGHIARAEELLAQAQVALATGATQRAVSALRLALAFCPEHPAIQAKLEELTGEEKG